MTKFHKFKSRLKSKSINWFHASAQGSKLYYLQESLRQAQIANDYLMSILHQSRSEHPNPLLKSGRKFFSQSDEDGILLEILHRIGRDRGTCVEIGAGNGLENNTLILACQGWRTVWIDAQPLLFDADCNPKILSHHEQFVDVENVVRLVNSGLSNLDANHADLISIDVDGNDGYLAEALLASGMRPEVIVIEINELLPPPIRFAQPYDAKHVWDKSKNSGWSLQSVIDLLQPFGYACVGCNAQTGVNAFFIRTELLANFSDVPRDPRDLFVGRSIHAYKYRDHRTQATPELIEGIIRSAQVRD
jgi:hypothetical protein